MGKDALNDVLQELGPFSKSPAPSARFAPTRIS